MRRYTVGLAVVAAVLHLAAAAPALAHWTDQSVAELIISGSSVRVTVTLPAAVGAAPRAEFFAKRLLLSDESGPGVVRLVRTRPPADGTLSATHTTFELDYSWPRPVQALTIRYALFPAEVPAASCLATIIHEGRVQTFVFTPQNAVLTVGDGWGRALTRLGSVIALGIEHILTGYDHLLFLLSLLMLSGTLRDLLKIVSAFTAAHSITLSLAALNLISLPGRWVESAIALSIVIVAAENLLRTGITLRRRWALTFGFGLIHGLGFAAVLRDLELPRAALVSSLVGFNLGVEVGQIAIVAVAYGALRVSRRWPNAPVARRWISVFAAAAGLVWFVQRALYG